MEAKELRIGNWYRFDGVTRDDFHQIEAYDIAELAGFPLVEGYAPIPLTEEWLIKFGFIKRYADCFEHGKFILNDKFVMMDIDITIKLKHVHQLQNLYHALTNTELSTK